MLTKSQLTGIHFEDNNFYQIIFYTRRHCDNISTNFKKLDDLLENHNNLDCYDHNNYGRNLTEKYGYKFFNIYS